MTRNMTRLRHAAPLLAALALAGCGDGGVNEVRTWMKKVQKDTKPSVKPLPAAKPFVPYAYNPGGAPEPFSPDKLLTEMARVAEASGSKYKPDTNRPKELLENYPLDTMRMVGTLQKAGVHYALVQIDKAVYQVRAGQRIGENYGVVTRVADGAIHIREVMQDATGDWVEREATIQLQDSKETGK
ncbi:pilus assembly protein PilP [Massilia sp. ST3]|uniref:pilus assembly protein PilP n=1 Tax=Massilia sp. ST3 TaxID=2824903 RepID=UPI001E3A1C26|nr:pilus assembly protein PilP [Massilia sp. ST3]